MPRSARMSTSSRSCSASSSSLRLVNTPAMLLDSSREDRARPCLSRMNQAGRAAAGSGAVSGAVVPVTARPTVIRPLSPCAGRRRPARRRRQLRRRLVGLQHWAGRLVRKRRRNGSGRRRRVLRTAELSLGLQRIQRRPIDRRQRLVLGRRLDHLIACRTKIPA